MRRQKQVKQTFYDQLYYLEGNAVKNRELMELLTRKRCGRYNRKLYGVSIDKNPTALTVENARKEIDFSLKIKDHLDNILNTVCIPNCVFCLRELIVSFMKKNFLSIILPSSIFINIMNCASSFFISL